MSKERELLNRVIDWYEKDSSAGGLAVLIQEIKDEMYKPNPEPTAWLYDWYADEDRTELIKDWTSSRYDDAHSELDGCHNIRALYSTQQQQIHDIEPFGYWVSDDKSPYFMLNNRPNLGSPSDEWVEVYMDNITALYTTPQQHRLLTDDDIKKIYAETNNSGWAIKFARAIEKAITNQEQS